MAMLAEPKRKQKLSVDPRNKAWISDGCKFGEKLMKKMGWQEGKGLGMNEDGSTSSISVSVKNNSLGLGFSQQHDDNWIGHQDDFNDLLSSLNQDHSMSEDKKTPIAPQNLQEKSKKAKRYKKFTRGKDLSSRSTSDMNCIMGVRSNSGTPKDRSRDPSRNQSETNSAAGSDSDPEDVARTGFGFASTSSQQNHSVEDNSFGVQTITSSNSIQEYFALKMKELHKKRKVEAVSDSNTVSSSNSDPNDAETMETEETSVTCNSVDSEDVNQKEKKKRKSKKKRRKEKLEVLAEEQSSQDSSQDGDCSKSHDKSHDMSHDMADGNESSSFRSETNGLKKKKKRKLKCVVENEDGVSVDIGERKTDIAKKKKKKTKDSI
ncbi:PIN2/TERF1-interacting telomerase inhibitor 1-like [Patiria miniata]|uniref:G-patch domain-containing protein n=1 Tax=Patiria miniata TaxID=46514 RepID=A0A913ZNA3_PATMI|nr:PIN2/TERF1-interacting telomerase inhibitor 1-like [Patiria miniata]